MLCTLLVLLVLRGGLSVLTRKQAHASRHNTGLAMSEAVPHTISSAQFDTEPGAGSFASCGAASCTSASAIPTPVVRFLPRERGELSEARSAHCGKTSCRGKDVEAAAKGR